MFRFSFYCYVFCHPCSFHFKSLTHTKTCEFTAQKLKVLTSKLVQDMVWIWKLYISFQSYCKLLPSHFSPTCTPQSTLCPKITSIKWFSLSSHTAAQFIAVMKMKRKESSIFHLYMRFLNFSPPWDSTPLRILFTYT